MALVEMLTAMTLALFLLVSLVCLVVLVALAGQLAYMAARELRRRLFGRSRRRRLVEASNEPRKIPIEPAFQWPEKRRMDAHTKRRAA